MKVLVQEEKRRHMTLHLMTFMARKQATPSQDHHPLRSQLKMIARLGYEMVQS